jgi:hypothetical protein
MTKPRKRPASARTTPPKRVVEGMDALVRKDPRYADLFDILLMAGGEAVAEQDEPDLAKLLERGYLRSGRGSRRASGNPISCHENAARLWEMNPDSVVIVTGWALSKDGLWRQHSWVKDSVDGRLYETTRPRVAYFGFDLTPDESQRFYESNVLHLR